MQVGINTMLLQNDYNDRTVIVKAGTFLECEINEFIFCYNFIMMIE